MKKDSAPATDKTVFRLTDMIVEEVSAVDAAANKRKFILVKNASVAATAATGEVVASATGELTVTKAPSSTEGPSEAVPSSPEAPPIPSATNTVEQPNGTTLKLSPEYKAELGERIKAAGEQLAKMLAEVSGAEEVLGLLDVPQSILDGFTSVVSSLSSGVTKSAVEKGRKQISMARESKLREAHKALSDIVAELDAVPTPEPVVAVEPPAVAPAPAAAPAQTEKSVALLQGLVSLVEKQTSAIQKQALRIDSIERARPQSNAGIVESTPVVVAKKEEAPVWPLDMNAPAGDGGAGGKDFTSR